MKKIKVLMLGWEYPPYVEGGQGTHCYYLTKALAKLGVKVYFVTPHPIHKKKGNLEIIGLDISQKFREKGKIINYGRFTGNKIREYDKKILDVVKKYNFDIIHCQDTPPINASILAKNFSRKPSVITVHSTEYDREKKPRRKVIKMEKRGMRKADRIIAVSNYTKGVIVKKNKINPRKISVIPNAVQQKKSPGRKRIGKMRYILCLGRLTHQKGIPYLIEAAKKVLEKRDDVKFLIIGKGDIPSYEKTLKQKVRRLGLEKSVIFKGYVKDKDYYYKKAYLFLMPSVSEPFGITPLEALINGTPVIISKQSGIAEFLKNCLKFNYWDTNDLAKKILFLLKDKKVYEKLRRNGLKEVQNFTWENIAKETLGVYRKVLE